jgi:hypothetical protein
MLVTIGANTITLVGVNGVGTNTITQQDFLLAWPRPFQEQELAMRNLLHCQPGDRLRWLAETGGYVRRSLRTSTSANGG